MFFRSKITTNKMSLLVQHSVIEQFSFKGKIYAICACSKFVGIDVSRATGLVFDNNGRKQLKSMRLKDIWCGLKTLKIL